MWKYLLEVKGKKGKMLVCQDRECGYRKGLAQITNVDALIAVEAGA